MTSKDRPPWLSSAILLTLACFGTAVASGRTEDDTAAIQAARERSNDAIRRHDVAGIVAVLEDDARLTTSSGQFFDGREAQRQAYADQFARFPDVVYVRTPDTVEVSRVGPFAAERGSWVGRWTAAAGPVEVRGAYMAMWHETQGRWRIRSELFVAFECQGKGCAK